MTQDEILEAFKTWGKTSLFYEKFAIPFFIETKEGKRIMQTLVNKNFHSVSELQIFMQTSIGVK